MSHPMVSALGLAEFADGNHNERIQTVKEHIQGERKNGWASAYYHLARTAIEKRHRGLHDRDWLLQQAKEILERSEKSRAEYLRKKGHSNANLIELFVNSNLFFRSSNAIVLRRQRMWLNNIEIRGIVNWGIADGGKQQFIKVAYSKLKYGEYGWGVLCYLMHEWRERYLPLPEIVITYWNLNANREIIPEQRKLINSRRFNLLCTEYHSMWKEIISVNNKYKANSQ